MGKFTEDNVKISDKARELGIKTADLIARLRDAGYDYKTPNSILSSDALQYLDLEEELVSKPFIEDSIEQAVVVPKDGKFILIKFFINHKFESQEISRIEFDSKVRAYYELNYLVSRYEQGR
jgi:hypothetical protein